MSNRLDRSAAVLVFDGAADVGEGPFWDRRDARLVWVDIPRGVVHRFDPATEVDDPFVLSEEVELLEREAGTADGRYAPQHQEWADAQWQRAHNEELRSA